VSESPRNWFSQAGLDEEVLPPESASVPNVPTPLGGRGRFGMHPSGAGFDVGEIPLGRNEDGAVDIPPSVSPIPVLRVSEAPEPEMREYVLDGLVPEGAATSLYGDGGVAKSLLAMSLCVSAARGQDRWMGRDVKGCAALYVDFELTADEQVRRAKALCRGSGYGGVPDELHYMSALGHDSDSAFWSAYKAADDYGVGLLVVDSFGLALHGEAESATDVIGFYKSRLEPFVSEGIAVVLVDHQAKGGTSYQQRTSFGSVYKRNLVRSEIQVEALDQDEDRGTLDLVFRHTKHNFGPRIRPFGAQVGFSEGEIQIGPVELEASRMVLEEGMKATDRVLLAMSDLDGPITAMEITEHSQMNLKTVKNALTSLKRRRKIRATGDKVGRHDVVEIIHSGTVPQPSSFRPVPNDGTEGTLDVEEF
jgi:hypothetical protein